MEINIKKKCTKCGETKELAKFGKNKLTKSGYKSKCLDCYSEYEENYRERHRVEINLYKKQWSKENPDKIRSYQKQK